MKQAPPTSEALVAEGNLLTEQDRFTSAISAYINALKLDLNNYLAFHHLGLCLAKQNRLAEAASFYYYAIQLNPDFSWSYYSLGEVFFKQNKLRKAIACYQQSIKLNSEQPWSYMGMANAYKAQGNEQQAIICYQLAIALKPDLFWAYFQLANLWRQQSKYQQAVVCLYKALEINPNFEPAYRILEFMPIAENQLDRLIRLYQKIVQKQPNIYQAWANLGDTLTRKEKLSQAINCYQKSCYYKIVNSHPHLAQFYNQNIPQKSPDFIIMGVGKCGTTSLYKYLSQHPQVLSPHNKELNFFNYNFARGIDWYLAHFPAIADCQGFITGEASPSYFAAPHADERIFQSFPQVKLIVLLRNPVERLVSHYHHLVREGFEKNSLEVALNLEIKTIEQATEAQLTHHMGYLGVGMYIYKLKRWLSLFPQQQLLILKSEDFYQNTPLTMLQVGNFLNLAHETLPDYPKYNSGSYRKIDDNLRQQLSRFFQPHNQKLENFLNRKFNWK